MNKLHFIFFILIFFSVFFLMHFYVYQRINSGLSLESQVSMYLKIFFLLGALSFFLGEVLSRQIISPWINPVAYLGTMWLGILSISLTVFIVRDISLLFIRADFFKYYSAIIAIIVVVLLSLYSVYNAARGLSIKEINIKMSKLPENLPKFTIVQLSDIHLNYVKSTKWFDNIISQTDKLEPDLIVITGDLVDADVSRINGLFEGLKKLKSRYGVFAVTGNHEFYAGIDKFLRIANESNIRILRNENVTIADSIELVGVDEPQSKRFSDEGADLTKALSQPNEVDTKKTVVLLSHRPDIFDNAAKVGVDLQLSGHYHVGQIPPLDLIVMLYYKYPYGLYKNGSSYLYTTSGTGTWGPAMRLFSRSEIVKIVLRHE